MKKRIVVAFSIFFCVFIITGCSSEEPPTFEVPPSSFFPEVQRISAEEVKSKLDAGENLIIVDSRSEEKYNESHIIGAISIPFETMEEPYSVLDDYDEIAIYCT